MRAIAGIFCFQKGKGGRDLKTFCKTLREYPREQKDITVGTTAGGLLDAYPAATSKPNESLMTK
jgi:hypothetical protein